MDQVPNTQSSPLRQASTPASKSPPAVGIGEAVWFWLKLGFISFGGPAGQISVMHQELVERRRWLSEHRFLHALNYAMVLPGPEAQQLATYIGWLMHGAVGGIIAGVLFVLPSFFIIIGLAWAYLVFGETPGVAGILYGIKPAVTAVVVFAAYRIGSRALRNSVLWVIAAAAFVALFAFNVPFPYVVLGAMVVGIVGSRVAPQKFTAGAHGSEEKSYGPAIIDDDTPPAEHARFRWSRLLMVAGVGLALWAGALAFLVVNYGWDGTLTRMGWFFTKAALVTFGGAYAVLPYVYQGGVETYQWLTGVQMIDGLALGETTPGPLIMIVTFVGFVGGWTKAMFGAEALALAGIAAATVATVFTFLPSFMFILVGGPMIEATRHEIRLTGPLTAITAAVVGVILNLALFFAWHVLWPEASADAPFSGHFEWFALVMTLAAFLALWRFKIGIIPVIAGCAAIGLAVQFLI
jgi:chromate transporter